MKTKNANVGSFFWTQNKDWSWKDTKQKQKIAQEIE